jgi:hypothetical protein
VSNCEISSLQWWRWLAVLIAVVIVVSSITSSLAPSSNRVDDGTPVIVLARAQLTCSSFAEDGRNWACNSQVPTSRQAVDNPQLRLNNFKPKDLGGRSLLASSSPLRC